MIMKEWLSAHILHDNFSSEKNGEMFFCGKDIQNDTVFVSAERKKSVERNKVQLTKGSAFAPVVSK